MQSSLSQAQNGTQQLFSTPWAFTNFSKHHELKDTLLKMIKDMDCEPVPDDSDKISKTDWFTYRKPDKDYAKLLIPAITKDVADCIEELKYYKKYQTLDVLDIWFQQYTTSDAHSWHKHDDCVWVAVYFLELPEGSPGTELKDIMNENNILRPEVKEGDILVFASNVLHRSPPNLSDKNKTIISFNFN